MKANPVYKCQRCSKIVINSDIELEPDELSCIPTIDTHICDISMLINFDEQDYTTTDQIGIIKLVGYNEVPDV